jgi:hypothetical protein
MVSTEPEASDPRVTVEYACSTPPITSTTQASETLAQAGTDGSVGPLDKLRNRASNGLGDDNASSVEAQRAMPSRKLCENDEQDQACPALSTPQTLQNEANGNPENMYHYTRLPEADNIRLIRLLYSEDENAPIRCQLFNYSLRESGKRTHPYDALSYVWGNPDETRPIVIDKHVLHVTVNLHDALSQLRYRSIERIIWVDAVCINQNDTKEKEQQIQFMAKIYGQANRVVVWLGRAANRSDQALEEIRVAGGKTSTTTSNKETMQQAVLALLRRPWFRRIWVREQTLDNIAEVTKTSI